MTVSISVRGDVREVLDDLGKLKTWSPGMRRAIAAALTRTAKTIISGASREIAKGSRLPVKIVRGRFGRVQVKPRRLVAVIRARLSPVPARILGQPRETLRGVAVGRRAYRGAFIARNKRGKFVVFRRKAKPRLPIEEMAEPLLNADDIITRHLRTTGRARFAVEFRRAAEQALRNPGRFSASRRSRRR